MKTKTIIGWSIIICIALIPTLILFVFGPGNKFADYGATTHALGQVAALTGITIFALTFILAMRLAFVEDIFGGLDKVYIAHGILGGTALILVLFHPILLVLKFIPSNMPLAAAYLLPSAYWSVNFGIIALLGLILLLAITLFIKIRYHTWKFTHEFLGLVFIFAVFHMFLVRRDASQDYIFKGYYVFATVVAIIGLGGFIYSLFLKNRFKKSASYFIKSITKRDTSYELVLTPERKPLSYQSGQFVFVRFYNKALSTEAHPFSIASRSNNPEIRIIIKSLGDFTSQLNCLSKGDKVSLEGPFGRFNFNREGNKGQVWVAGGIGITPFLGMAEDIKNTTRPIDLFYSVKEEKEFIGLDELQAIAAKTKKFRVFPWITKTKGYITLDAIKKQSGLDKEFYLCGPASMKKSIIADLKKAGISDDHIYSEEFTFK
jgi:predicted ferric reductase